MENTAKRMQSLLDEKQALNKQLREIEIQINACFMNAIEFDVVVGVNLNDSMGHDPRGKRIKMSKAKNVYFFSGHSKKEFYRKLEKTEKATLEEQCGRKIELFGEKELLSIVYFIGFCRECNCAAYDAAQETMEKLREKGIDARFLK